MNWSPRGADAGCCRGTRHQRRARCLDEIARRIPRTADSAGSDGIFDGRNCPRAGIVGSGGADTAVPCPQTAACGMRRRPEPGSSRMMDHAHYRSAIMADPHDSDPDLRAHRESCAECRAFTEQLLRFEARLERALLVDILPKAAVLPFARTADAAQGPRRW